MSSNYLTAKKGIMGWIFSLDHKRIGIMYLKAIGAAFLLGGVAALVLRFELLSPDKIILTAKEYNQKPSHYTAQLWYFYLLFHQYLQH